VSADAIYFASLALLGVLGFVFGRRKLVLLLASPIVFWLFWGAANTEGPDDDVTGPASAFLGAVSVGAVLLGLGIRWLVYGVAWIWQREPAESRPRRF